MQATPEQVRGCKEGIGYLCGLSTASADKAFAKDTLIAQDAIHVVLGVV